MALIVKTSKAQVDVPAGETPAIIVQIIDLGQQFKRNWQTQEIELYPDGNPQIQAEVMITFELPLVTNKDGDPAWVSKRYTISLHEKAALTKLLDAAGVTGNDLSDLMGKKLLVDIDHTSGGNPKIKSTRAAKRIFVMDDDANTTVKISELEQKNPSFIISIEDALADKTKISTLPQFLQDLMLNQASKEVYERELLKDGRDDRDTTEGSDTEY